MRRAVGAVVLVVGLGMIASLFALHIFTRTDQAKNVLDDARPVLVGAGLKAMRRDLNHAKPAGGELRVLVPELASRLGLTTDALVARHPGLNVEQDVDIGTAA